MPQTTKRILLSCLVIVAVICLCLSVISIGASGFMLLQPESFVVLTAPEGNQYTPKPTSSPFPETSITQSLSEATATPQPDSPGAKTTDVPPGAGLPLEVAREMDSIEDQVVGLRKLEPIEAVDRKLLSPEELRRHIQEDFLKDYTTEEADKDALILAALGLLPSGFELRDFYIELLTEQVAGFYDDEDKAMYVVQGEGFNGPERLTYSHEYTHALQDQHYDFNDSLGYNDQACEANSERCAAIQALIEGDATVLEFQWFTEHSTPDDMREIQEFYANNQSPVYDSAPAFIKEDLIFPYQAGQTFVEQIFEQGGWEAVDAVFGNPPLSTEQILHPERYPDDKPVDVILPDLSPVLGQGWSELDRSVMGEWFTYLILAQGLEPGFRLDDRTARQAAEGWGGNAYVFYINQDSGKIVMALSTSWDSVSEARQFAAAFRRYATARFGDPSASQNSYNAWESPEGVHTFRLDTSRTIWILAVDAPQAEAIWQILE